MIGADHAVPSSRGGNWRQRYEKPICVIFTKSVAIKPLSIGKPVHAMNRQGCRAAASIAEAVVPSLGPAERRRDRSSLRSLKSCGQCWDPKA